MSILTNRMSLKAVLATLTMSVGLSLSGCQLLESQNQPLEPVNHPNATQCEMFNPDVHMACTMEYDPVCVKEKDANGNISYRTAGNDCSACNSAQAISYTPGECK